MKKVLTIALIVIAVGGTAMYLQNNQITTEEVKVASQQPDPAAGSTGNNADQGLGNMNPQLPIMSGDLDLEPEIKPADQVYKSAAEALDAVKKSAASYDDIVLEQFANLGDCSWCAEFYKGLKDLFKEGQLKIDEKSYFAEILATSGKLENVQFLAELVKETQNAEEKTALAESLEYTTGDEATIKYLSTHLATDDKVLKNSAIAAIANQGTRLSAELLYKEALDSKDPSGHETEGIGLSEMIPEEDAISYLHDMVLKKDDYSHLAVKALLNAGLPGITIVFDSLANSNNPEIDAKLLGKEAMEHVGYDEDTKQYLEKMATSANTETLKNFAKQILEDFKAEEEDMQAAEIESDDISDLGGEGEVLQSINPPAHQ